MLGAMDDIDFLHPVKVGEIAILRAQVEYVGTSSLEVGVRVWAENVTTGRRGVTLNSHLVFVSVDDDAKPPLDQREILAIGADQRRSRAVVVEVDDDLGLGRNLHVAVKFAAGSERR